MTARLSGRLARLERAAGVRGACPECGDRGRPAFQMRIDGVDQRQARGCARCGRISVLKVVCIDEPDDEGGLAAAWPEPKTGRAP